MSVAALQESDLEKIQMLIESKEFCSPKRIGLLRATITIAPLPQPQPDLPPGTAIWSRREPEQPAWATLIVEHRDFFSDCALVFCANGVPQYYKVVYGVQKPNTYLALCQLHPTNDYTASELPNHPTAKQIAAASHGLAFRCNFAVMATAADLQPLEMKQLSVLFGMKHRGGVIVTTDDSPMPLRAFLSGQATPKEQMPAPIKDLVVDKEFESLVLQMPWLDHLTLTDSFVSNVKKAAAASAGSGASTKHLEEFECDEDEILTALAKVDKARAAEGCIAVARGHTDFKCIENYGKSNVKKGKAFHDAVQGVCHTKDADRWSRGHGLQVTFKASFSEHTEEPCRILVRSWVHRMQFFYDYELCYGESDKQLVFTGAMLGYYAEPDELTRLAEVTTKASTVARIALIRRIPFR